MAESKSSNLSASDKEVKAPNVFERAKEEMEAILHTRKQSAHRHKETHGLRNDIDEKTPTHDVKAPNVFERAKEEIEAIVEAIHPKKEPKTHSSPPKGERRNDAIQAGLNHEKPHSEGYVNAHNSEKEELEATTQKKSPHHQHQRETHGRSDDIDENTPISEIKGPSLLERAKEELEALVETIHPKKESGNLVSSPAKEGGFRVSIGKGLEKVCSPPWGHKRDRG